MIKKLADKLFKWYCNPEYYPDIKGDLEELYSDHLESNSKTASFKYLIDVLLLFRISLIRPFTQNSIIKDTGMFRNYFKISVRNLARHKLFTAINVIGLAVGLASFLLIYEYIKFERSYDSFHQQADQLYRVSYVRVINGSEGDKDAMSAHPVGKTLEEKLPEVIQHTVSKKFDFSILKYGDISFRELRLISADDNFLQLFNYPAIEGDLETMLSDPNSIVLTAERAKAYFGNQDPIGKTLTMVNPFQRPLKVTGILADPPDNTHYSFDILISDKILQDEEDYGEWNWNNYYSYVKTTKGVDVTELELKANMLLDEFLNDKDKGESLDNGTKVGILPVRDIYLSSDFDFEPQVLGNKKAINFLMVISIFILVVAWVNYTNLSTARSIERAKEVGLRKVVGAFKNQLIVQFLVEAFIINAIGGLLALCLSEIMLPFFNTLVGKTVLLHVWDQSSFVIAIFLFVLIGTLASGYYPALVLSGFQPVTILKGKFQSTSQGITLRRALVIIQFTTSIVLVASTMIVYQQVSYMQGRDLGISVDQVVSVTVPNEGIEEEEWEAFTGKLQRFKEKLTTYQSIESVGATSNLPGGESIDINSTTTVIKILGSNEGVDGTTYAQYNDEGFMDAVDMKLIAGRNFDRTKELDKKTVMVNESFLRRLNIPDFESVLGKKLQFGENEKLKYTIIGVVKDFNRTSLKIQVEPTLYIPWFSANNLVIEIDHRDFENGLESLKTAWEEFYPELPFSPTFLDARFKALYDQDRKFGDTFLVFSVLAIIIALLGLFGLASFLANQRAKEIGVRKVLGASIAHIIFIFYKNFLLLLSIASVIGFTIVYFTMNDWLNNYAYRIDFPWYLLIAAFVIVLLSSMVTVTYQVRKVAALNPAQTLKYE